MSTTSEQLLEGGGLRLRFAFRDDRYMHEISLADRSRWIPILTSAEGSPLEDWPASPPLQSLHLESRPGNRQLALSVGMAGKSHWSMSVELDPAAARLTFDIACRTPGGAVGRVGSRYNPLHPLAEQNSHGAIYVPIVATSGRLGLEICDRLGHARLEANAGVINIVALPPSGDQPQTVRWGYAVWRESD